MPEISALLIIDVQHGFINQHTSAIPALVEKEQVNYDLVWATRLEYTAESPLLTIRKLSGFDHVYKPTELAFNVRSDARIILKHGYSAVSKEFLEELHSHNVTMIELAGMDTDQCVLATALGLFDANITPKIIVDRCFSTGGPEAHEAGIAVLRRALGSHNLIYRESKP